jgi:hypothetical protein
MASAVSQRGTFLRPTFYRLPTEVIFYVFCWLTAKDIIGLRRVCKRLNNHTIHRSIWRRAARLLIEDHGILSSTYPVGSWTATALEHLATQPYRFLSKVGSGIPNYQYTYTISSLEPGVTRTTCLKFIPGGRWLLAGLSDGVLQCLDLNGSSSGTIGEASKVAELEGNVFNWGCCELLVQSEPDRESAIILASHHHPRQGATAFMLDVIRFTPDPPSLKKVNSAYISDLVFSLQLRGDLVVWHDSKDVVVWNWRQDTWVTMVGMISNQARSSFILHQPHLTILDFGSNIARQYTVPEPRPLLMATRSIPCIEVVPSETYELEPLPPSTSRLHVVTDPACSWQPSVASSMSPFLIATESELRMYAFSPKGSSLPLLHTRIQRDVASSAFEYDADMEFSWHDESQSLLTMLAPRAGAEDVEDSSNSKITRMPELHTYTLHENRPEDPIAHSQPCWKGTSAWERTRFTFCPLAGRICFTQDQETIQVYEFTSQNETSNAAAL